MSIENLQSPGDGDSSPITELSLPGHFLMIDADMRPVCTTWNNGPGVGFELNLYGRHNGSRRLETIPVATTTEVFFRFLDRCADAADTYHAEAARLSQALRRG